MSSSCRNAGCLSETLTRSVWSLAVFAALVAGQPRAADYAITGFFSESLSASHGSEQDVNSQTSVGLSFSARTPTTSWLLSPGATLSLSSDSSVDGVRDVNPRISGSVAHRQPLYRLNGGFSIIPRFRSSRRIDEITGLGDDDEDPDAPPDDTDSTTTARFASENPLELTSSIFGGVSYTVDPLTTLSLSASYRRRDFLDASPSFQDNERFSLNAGLSHSLTTRTSANFSASASHFAVDGQDGKKESNSFQILGGFSSRFTPRHNAGLSVGGSLVSDDDDENFSFSFNGRFSYRPKRETSFALTASQGIDQNEDGDVENVFSFGGTASHRINSVSSASLTARVQLASDAFDVGDSRRSFSVVPSYNYRLTRLWSIRAGYALTIEDENDSTDVEGRLFLQISRSFDLY